MHKHTKASFRSFRSFPWLTFVVAAIAVAAQTDEVVSRYLAYDRMAIRAGEIWRILTGHLVHWSGNHLFWDVVMFITLGAIVESRHRNSFIVTLMGSAAAISAVLWFCHPTIGQYRGLSGLDSALFTQALVSLASDARRAGHAMICRLMFLFVLGFAAKIAYELVTGDTLFVDSSLAGFSALPSVHMIGGLIGGLCGIAMLCRLRRLQEHALQPGCTARMWATTSRMSS
jgi:rhomboid family GlyGly-CTERM serine protease